MIDLFQALPTGEEFEQWLAGELEGRDGPGGLITALDSGPGGELDFGGEIPTPTIARDAILVDQFGQDWFDRLHFSALTFDLGNLISLQIQTFTIWSAYRRAIILDAITSTDDEGVSIDGPAQPTQFGALQEYEYTLTIDTEGPPNLRAVYTFDFGFASYDVTIIGERTIAWTFAPDWSRTMLEALDWRTDVIISFDAREQRRALRTDPRMSLEFETFQTGADRRYLETLLWGWGARPWALPIWHNGQNLAGALTAGQTVIPLDTFDRGFIAGGLALVAPTPRDFEIMEIETVGADSITLRRPVIQPRPAGTLLYPARIARLQDRVRVPRWDHDGAGARVLFEATEPEPSSDDHGLPLYRGLPVLERRPNWVGGFDLELQRKLAELDNMTGRRFFDDEAGVPLPVQSMRWTMFSRQERSDYRRFIYYMRGRQRAAWIPTWTDDLRVVADLGDGQAFVDIEDMRYTAQAATDTGRRDLRIELTDGTVIYRRIDNSDDQGGGVERLSLDAGIAGPIQVAQIAQVCFISLMRLNTDRIEMSYWTGDTAESFTPLRGFQHEL
jgi:hypothetical protein